MRNVIKINGITTVNYDQPGFYYVNQLKEPEINLLIRNNNFSGTAGYLEYTFDDDPNSWYRAHNINGTTGQELEVNYGDLQGIYGLRIIPGSPLDVYSMIILEYYLNTVIVSQGI